MSQTQNMGKVQYLFDCSNLVSCLADHVVMAEFD
jgi:hypothetical protein